MKDREAAFAGRRVLITGAGGFLGRPLVRRLGALGAEVHAFSRREQPADVDYAWWMGDASVAADVERVFEAVRPEVVYHLTSASQGGRELGNVLPTVQDDLVATVQVLVASAATDVSRFVFAASLEAPRPGEGDPVPVSPYAAAKWAGESYTRMFHALYGLPIVIVRPFMTYGPGQKPFKIVPHVVRTLLEGAKLEIRSGDRLVDWVYVDDVVEALVLAGVADEAVGRSIDLGSGELKPIKEVVEIIARLVGGDGEAPEFGEAPAGPTEVVRAANVDEAFETLGWRATTTLEVGLRHTVDEQRESMRS